MAKYMKSPPNVVSALMELGLGDTPTQDVVEECEEFLCSLLITKKVSAFDATTLRVKRFKNLPPNQGVENFHQLLRPCTSTL